MIIGLLQVEVFLPECNSLKDKRSVIKTHLHRIRRTYNVAVAETGLNDIWRRAELAFVSVNSRKDAVERAFERIRRELETAKDMQLIHDQVELL